MNKERRRKYLGVWMVLRVLHHAIPFTYAQVDGNSATFVATGVPGGNDLAKEAGTGSDQGTQQGCD